MLLVHGHYYYIRISELVQYFFYKVQQAFLFSHAVQLYTCIYYCDMIVHIVG